MKTRDAEGRICCAECLAPRGTPHWGGCSNRVRPTCTHAGRKPQLVRLDKDEKGNVVPVIFMIPPHQNMPSAHLVDPTKAMPRWIAREEKQRLRKQRRAMKARAARDLARAA